VGQVLRHGGVYADIDTECRKPIDDFVRASDTLVVGWENEFATDDEAYARHFVRRRQVRQESESERPRTASHDSSTPRPACVYRAVCCAEVEGPDLELHSASCC
jgi:hypothetical protein